MPAGLCACLFSFQDRWGDLPPSVWKQLIDDAYLIPFPGHVDLVATIDGQEVWLLFRHPLNDGRGDASSVKSRKKSVEGVGLLRDQRSGPWLQPVDSSMSKFWVLHWATLIQGCEAAWAADPEKKNVVFQQSIRSGLDDCKMYHPNTPDDVVRWLCGWGNIVNGQVTTTTALTVLKSTKEKTCFVNIVCTFSPYLHYY